METMEAQEVNGIIVSGEQYNVTKLDKPTKCSVACKQCDLCKVCNTNIKDKVILLPGPVTALCARMNYHDDPDVNFGRVSYIFKKAK